MIEESKQRTRICPRCKRALTREYFARTNSIFFPGHRAIFCTSCLEEMVPADNWDSVDALLRWLDLPFDMAVWAKLFKTNGKKTLSAYLNFVDTNKKYDSVSWVDLNREWKEALEKGQAANYFPDISIARKRDLIARWSDQYSDEEYLFLDALFDQICNTQNVSTPILKEYAKDFCEITLRIKKKIRAGEDVKKEMDSRDNIIKVAKFDAQNAVNTADFDSVGELITYYSKKGWQPNWCKEKNDVVDFTMDNIQQYLLRIVRNESSIADQVEQKRETYNTAKRLEKEELYQDLEDEDDDIDFEDADELDKEWDIE